MIMLVLVKIKMTNHWHLYVIMLIVGERNNVTDTAICVLWDYRMV